MCKTFCGEFTVFLWSICYSSAMLNAVYYSIKYVFYFIIIKKNVNLLTCKYSKQ